MYSLPNISEEFDSIAELVNFVLQEGVDPNYEVTKNGNGMGEDLTDFIVH